ncbi:hypothetical protein TSTA_116150 [Talaromyces stipitatus ATCC 10500]|uniref:Uncharacterized protein n=1 Tax=Talaromyces stipitatus (strain ATCC 10500 / CBS 375.48 / QM 6759 / NRRL 1006) TaxID=441959 RepID=B8MBG1_TALSN|nr:uncharacterized protein TSTA_116150 [Talaromyces stipitatus ATCC 10500]EED17825.1 hypothetical protein TSTA_116150 [Talaromyces stipitatus ATCC 10500]
MELYINTQDEFLGNALQAASIGEGTKVVQMLSEKVADLNAQDRQAEVNAQDGHYGNALQVASARANEKTQRTLFDEEANVDILYDYPCKEQYASFPEEQG